MIDLTMDEILEDLCYPGLPPGRWNVPPQAILHEAGDHAASTQEEEPWHEPRRRSFSTTPRR